MGGQACVFYGGAEFSRDLDLLVPLDHLAPVEAVLREQAAECIAVPAMRVEYLARGHAIHFRCRTGETAGLRIDLMARLRGMGEFDELWRRRTTIEVAGETVELLALADLVRAKKTQREKDWPMIRRLLERSYLTGENEAAPEQRRFWLMELRTPELLLQLAQAASAEAAEAAKTRAAVAAALRDDPAAVEAALLAEEARERQADREYWAPLKRELETLRHQR